ncbi:flagellar type III secretion system protein FlhA [bacterium]|nr:flagellar type III secretion system protein FlhA [bacterium]
MKDSEDGQETFRPQIVSMAGYPTIRSPNRRTRRQRFRLDRFGHSGIIVMTAISHGGLMDGARGATKGRTPTMTAQGMPARIAATTRSIEPWVLPVTLMGSLVVLLVPVPGAVMDLLLAANVTISVLILMTTITIGSPQQFSSLPTLLLTTTLSRLVLNVASTRLILLEGGTRGLDAAGGVIKAFGSFVAGDNILVGGVMFGIMVIIQFVVITKGSSRISEVAARFTLDGLPGRQMAIDSDLHAGLIDQAEAVRRREAVYRQADFFGAMDGAGKYVRGDAVAGVLITMINILGGLAIGIVQHGMSPVEAVDIFTKLTIGDGLVSQIPAFLISLGAGLVVTRSSSESDIGREMTGQLFGETRTLISAAVLLTILAFLGLPKLPLLSVAAILGFGAWIMNQTVPGNTESKTTVATFSKPIEARQEKSTKPAQISAPATQERKTPATTDASATSTSSTSGKPAAIRSSSSEAAVTDWLRVDAMELSIGYRLIALADPGRGGDLLDRLGRVRQRVARELGMIAPQVAIRDDLALQPQEYRIAIRGVTVAGGVSYPGRLLAIVPPGLTEVPEGREGVDPATDRPAVWIAAEGKQAAELAGCKVKEASAVIMDHLAEVIIHHADELLSRDQVMQLIERVRLGSASLVDEVVPNLIRVGEIQKVLQNLLRERVSILDMETILEALALAAVATRDPEELTEHARRALSRRLVQPYLAPDGHLNVVMLDKSVENRLAAAVDQSTRPETALGLDWSRQLVAAIGAAAGRLTEQGRPPILVVGSLVRRLVRDLTHTDLPGLVVLAQQEIPRDTPVDNIATVAPAGFEEADRSDAQRTAAFNEDARLTANAPASSIPAPHGWPTARGGRTHATVNLRTTRNTEATDPGDRSDEYGAGER